MENIARISIKPDFEIGTNKTPLASFDNFKRLLRTHQINIRYNEIRKEMDISIPDKNYLPDNYINCCEAEIIGLAAGYRMPTGNIFKFMKLAADENKFNPVAEWIESKAWDGKSRVEDFYNTIKSSNEESKKALMQRWMVSAIAALYEPYGVSAGGMLVFLGKQYLGKTNWFKNLVPVEQISFIADGMSVDPRQRDSFMPCLEHWLVELGEIDSTFKRADLSALKAFINRQQDIVRMAYGAANSRYPRRTIFFGSVDKKSYLKDRAGNRRFWTIECTEINHTHGLDMQQVWAEFKVLYDNKEPWLLTRDEHSILTKSNKEFEEIDPLEEMLIKKYNFALPLNVWESSTEILINLGYSKPTQSETTRMAMIVRKHNGDLGKTSAAGRLLALPTSNF